MEAQPRAAEPRPDVVVVGAGLIGCAISWRLAQRGLRPLLVDRGPPGAEASSAAAGILAPQAEASGPGPFLDLCLRSFGLYGRFVEELRERTGADVGHRTCGVLELALTEGELDRLDAVERWSRAAGLPVERLEGAALAAAAPWVSPRARAGLVLPREQQVEPRRLVAAVWAAARLAGVRYLAGSVTRVVAGAGGRIGGVEIEGRPVAAPLVVVAAGAWSSLLPGAALRHDVVRPIRGQLAELEPEGDAATAPPLRQVVFGGGGYLVPRPDGRVLAGTTAEDVGFRKEVTAGGLAHVLAVAAALAPHLAGAAIRATWSGLRPATPDRLPILGFVPEVAGLILATGHYRNGILLAPATAELVAALAAGEPPPVPIESFTVARFPLASS